MTCRSPPHLPSLAESPILIVHLVSKMTRKIVDLIEVKFHPFALRIYRGGSAENPAVSFSARFHHDRDGPFSQVRAELRHEIQVFIVMRIIRIAQMESSL